MLFPVYEIQYSLYSIKDVHTPRTTPAFVGYTV